MPHSNARSNENDDFFNDLSRNPDQSSESPKEAGGSNHSADGGDGTAARPKRIACILCRKRKLKCDGTKPSCGTCSRLGHDCAYDEVRKKSGPKRGYVKLLEARLKQVETLLETRDSSDSGPRTTDPIPNLNQQHNFSGMPGITLPGSDDIMPSMMSPPSFVDPTLSSMMPDIGLGAADDFSWEMIGLGLEEPLPTQDVIDDMNAIYFEKIHPSVPIIHRPRFLAAMNLAPHLRPPVCLRYAMWTQVCSVTPRYSALLDHFYTRARKYAEQDEMRGHGEGMITLAHSQCWTLLAGFEFKMMYFPRAWMSCGRATRLSQMMGLHRQDGSGLDVKQTLPPPRDWTEREERRRTFWMAFCQDRYASIGTGWPMTIDEQDILTNLPATEEAFNRSKPEPTLPLSEAMQGDGASTLSPFAGVILMACLFGRNLTHLHRPNAEDNDHDLNGEFWKRHRTLDNILLSTSLSLPAHLRLPAGLGDANIVFCNMNIHTSTICLHQAAIFKADKNRMPAQISAESKRRCIIAADQITNIMKMASHVDLSTMNPFISFCLYVAARVFVQYLKSRKEDSTVKSSLQFLLSAMQALRAKNPLTESFLVQLDVDLEGSGLDIRMPSLKFSTMTGSRPICELPINTDAMKCSPLFEIRESQKQGHNGEARAPTTERPRQMTNNEMPMDFSSLSHYDTPGSGVTPARARQSNNVLFPSNGNRLYPDNNQQGNEMDTSPDPNGAGSFLTPHSLSDHHTPGSNSNKASSNNSFTPPQFDDGATLAYRQSNSSGVSPNVGMYQTSDAYGQYATGNTYRDQQQQQTKEGVRGQVGMNNSFEIPAGWDLPHDGSPNSGTVLKGHNVTNLSGGGVGAAPSPGAGTGTGLTPLAMPDGGGWQMEGNEWMYGEWNASVH